MRRDNVWAFVALGVVGLVIAGFAFFMRGSYQVGNRERATCFDFHTGRDAAFYRREIAACTARIASGQEPAANLVLAYRDRGLAHIEVKEFQPAVADLSEAITRSPRNIELYLNRSVAYVRLGDRQNALANLDQAVRLKPNNPEALARRGVLHGTYGQHDAAIADLKRAVELAPRSFSIRGRLGEAYAQAGQCETALTHFHQAAAMAPKDARPLWSSAACLVQLKRGDEAVAEMDKAVALAPTAQGYFQRAELLSRLGHYPQAVADIGQALQRQDTALYRNDRCWFRALWGQQLDEALKDCNQALAGAPTGANVLDSRGLVYFRLRNFTAAKADYDAALKLRPDLQTSLYMRGLTRLKLGDAGGKADIAAARATTPGRLDALEAAGLKP